METISDELRQLTEGSVWSDENQRIIIIFRIIWANAVRVESFELLIIPDMKMVVRPALQIESLVKTGKMQFVRDCRN
ncbi:MAG: hypothetical protein U0X91_20815 [Spirosomataceae bacterium]